MSFAVDIGNGQEAKQARFRGYVLPIDAHKLGQASVTQRVLQVELRDTDGSRIFQAPARLVVCESDSVVLEVVALLKPPKRRADSFSEQHAEEERRDRQIRENRKRGARVARDTRAERRKTMEIRTNAHVPRDRKLQRNRDIVRLRAEGCSVTEIAIRMQLTNTRVYQILAQMAAMEVLNNVAKPKKDS